MLESIKKNKKGIILMIISSICACVGQMLWKMSADKGLIYMIVGFGFYGVGALVMIIAYRYGKLSVLQPMLSLNYVLSIVLAAIVLGEKVGFVKCIGVLVIIAGVRMLIYYIVLVIMTLSGAVASLFLKKASASESIIATIKNINLYIGGALYLVSALLNIYVLRYLDYSVVLPLTSVTYIWTMVISYFILKEKISKKKIGGVILILVGAVLVSVS